MGISKYTTVHTIYDCAASCAVSYHTDEFRCVAFTYLLKECTEFGNRNPLEKTTVEYIDTDPVLYLYTGEFWGYFT